MEHALSRWQVSTQQQKLMNVLGLQSFLYTIPFHSGGNELQNMHLLVVGNGINGKETFDVGIVSLMGNTFQVIVVLQQIRDNFTPC